MNFENLRKNMIFELKNLGIHNTNVLRAMNKIPRENFVLENLKPKAYENIPLPIGFSQTISQPYTVAFMLEALELKKSDKVLEIGTGSGYNAAILSLLVNKVITIETIKELTVNAVKNLVEYKNIKVISGDGSIGYKKESPYDKIIFTAACPEIPSNLLNQLKINGILLAPVGFHMQVMTKVIKTKNKLIYEDLGNFYFVPLRGAKGF